MVVVKKNIVPPLILTYSSEYSHSQMNTLDPVSSHLLTFSCTRLMRYDFCNAITMGGL